MEYQLNDFFDSLTDPRRGQGQRHKFHHVLMIVIMAIISGHQGLRGFARFAQANEKELTKELGLKHGVPCYFTFRTILMGLDNQVYADKFIKWVKGNTDESTDDFIALDGKSIASTTKGGQTQLQNFVAIVSAFGHRSGLVYGMKSFENGKSGEAAALRDLVAILDVKGKVLTMDALHTQKKHLT